MPFRLKNKINYNWSQIDNTNRKNEASEQVWDMMQNEIQEAYEESYETHYKAGYHEYEARRQGFEAARCVKKYYDDNFNELVKEHLKNNDNITTEDLIDFTEWNETTPMAVEVKDYDGPCVEAYVCE